METYKKYDIVMVDFGTNVVGSEQGFVRPALIVQNNKGNNYSPCTIVMPFTHVMKGMHIPTHAFIKKTLYNGLAKDSILLGEQIRAISKDRILKKLGTLVNNEAKSEVQKICQANFAE